MRCVGSTCLVFGISQCDCCCCFCGSLRVRIHEKTGLKPTSRRVRSNVTIPLCRHPTQRLSIVLMLLGVVDKTLNLRPVTFFPRSDRLVHRILKSIKTTAVFCRFCTFGLHKQMLSCYRSNNTNLKLREEKNSSLFHFIIFQPRTFASELLSTLWPYRRGGAGGAYSLVLPY